MIGLPEQLIMPCPFAGGSGAALATIPGDVTENEVNFTQGFPDVYSSPKSNGGKYVKRSELNAIGNMGTKNDFYCMCGGINTFNPDFAQKIGGYPKGAILDYFDGINFSKVISTVGNNMVDFNAKGFSDGSWRRLNIPEVLASVNIASIKDLLISASYSSTNLIASFTAPKDGELVVQPYVKSKTDTHASLPSNKYVFAGTGLMWAKFEDSSNSFIPSSPNATTSSYGDSSDESSYDKYWLLPGLPTGYKVGVSYLSSSSTTFTSDKWSPFNGLPLIKKNDFIVIVVQNGLINGVAAGGYNSAEYVVDIDISIK